MFLNTEITSLKATLEEACQTAPINTDKDLTTKVSQVIEKLDSFYGKSVEENVVFTILKTQALVKEITTDGD